MRVRMALIHSLCIDGKVNDGMFSKSLQNQTLSRQYLQSRMQALSFLSLLLLFSLGACSISEIPFQYNPVTYKHMLCLQSRGNLDEFFIEGQLQSTEEFKFFLSSVDFQGLETLALPPHFNITLQSLHFYLPPEPTAQLYANTLQGLPVKMLWFDVARTEEEITCDKVWTFVRKVQELTGKQIGIIGNKQDWVDKFGSESACSQFSVFPLYFSGEKFEPFGGWSGYQFSIGKTHISPCGIQYRDVNMLRMGGERQLRKEISSE